MANDRGQYGSRSSGPAAPSVAPWLIGVVAVATAGFAAIAVHASRRPRLTAHEKEVRAWEAEFPGLPWYADQVKDSRQLDLWERARDHWERSR